MELNFLKKSFDIAHIPYTQNESLASKSTFKVGGTAELFVTPQDVSQLQSAIGGASAAGEKYFILGGGSNIVFPDDSYKGIIISTQNINQILMTDDDFEFTESFLQKNPDANDKNFRLVTCGCGTSMASFVNFCTNHNLSGAEQFAGLPGTIGGAVFMNARCFEKSISDILYQTEFLELDNKNIAHLYNLEFIESQWDYKKSPFQPAQQHNQRYVTSATFILEQKNSNFHQEIEDKCKYYISQRVDKGHFKYPSAGSVFKNNRDFGKPSGKIIDDAGLKGYSIGGAKIADFHGNFIINYDNATQKDIKSLVEYIQKKIKELYGFYLEPEIIFVDNI